MACAASRPLADGCPRLLAHCAPRCFACCRRTWTRRWLRSATATPLCCATRAAWACWAGGQGGARTITPAISSRSPQSLAATWRRPTPRASWRSWRWVLLCVCGEWCVWGAVGGTGGGVYGSGVCGWWCLGWAVGWAGRWVVLVGGGAWELVVGGGVFPPCNRGAHINHAGPWRAGCHAGFFEPATVWPSTTGLGAQQRPHQQPRRHPPLPPRRAGRATRRWGTARCCRWGPAPRRRPGPSPPRRWGCPCLSWRCAGTAAAAASCSSRRWRSSRPVTWW